jgi:hypothetical protein
LRQANVSCCRIGDLLLSLDSEINPVITKMIESGIEITALHNHLPRTTLPCSSCTSVDTAIPLRWPAQFMRRWRLARRRSRRRPPHRHRRSISIQRSSTRSSVKGRADGGVCHFVVPRRDPITDGGMLVSPPGPFAAATEIGFQPTGGGKAASTGDFVMTADEVNPVIKALRTNGIEVAALHSHMIDEQPRLSFMHFDQAG